MMVTSLHWGTVYQSIICSAGNGLFIGNSMPIRDMDMYATWCQQSHAEASSSYSTASPQQSHTATWQASQGGVQYGVGAPVGSNRGASGIDGVLSTAAGFAAGLKRPTTLLVGDVSFLHDVNGLNLLRTGQTQPAVSYMFTLRIHHLPCQTPQQLHCVCNAYLTDSCCLKLLFQCLCHNC